MDIDITQEQEDKILRDVFDNFPEASKGMSLQCTRWNYKEFKFTFHDLETDKSHLIDLQNARKGFETYLKIVLLEETALDANPKNWDADNHDAIVQCAIFGKIIYG